MNHFRQVIIQNKLEIVSVAIVILAMSLIAVAIIALGPPGLSLSKLGF